MAPPPPPPLLLNTLHTATLITLGCITGVAASFLFWVIPIIRLASDSRTKLKQFNYTVGLGRKILQPTSRTLPVLLLSLAYLTYDSRQPVSWPLSTSTYPSPPLWTYYAAAVGIIVPTGPYEILTIFPTNDRMTALESELQQQQQQQQKKTPTGDFKDERDREIDRLLNKWQKWHVGRMVLPLLAAVVVAWAGRPVVSSKLG